MAQLTYLMDEICSGVEIYFTGRTGQQYLKTAFILCDDYTELTSKLFLKIDDPSWTDQKGNGRFKSYHDIHTDVQRVFSEKRPTDLTQIEMLLKSMKERHDRRNDFFHSTHLLDLSVTQRNCVEAFCDLMDYGNLLFVFDWSEKVKESRNLEVFKVLLRLEKKSFSDPAVTPKVMKILGEWPRNISISSRKGVHLAVHPEDLHLRLCVIHGGNSLKDKLSALL